MRIAMIFPGQGSQAVGMGRDLAATSPTAAAVFAQADAILDQPLSAWCFEGPLETLTETRIAQPALLTHSVALLRILAEHGVRPEIVAGHSVGEYAALVAAEVLEFETALHLVRRRGELMFESGRTTPGTMAAVIGLPLEAIAAACAAARPLGVCDLANHNADDQIVISGAVPAVEDAMRRAEAAGARMVKRLNVSGAFHSELMRAPGAALAAALEATAFRDARLPVIANVSGTSEYSGPVLKQLLERQIHSPVRWVESMRTLLAGAPALVLEVGPGTVLKGLLRRIDRSAVCESTGDRAGLEAALAKITTLRA
jgi:[acyl-carrier-protein] S-malonyltransferase